MKNELDIGRKKTLKEKHISEPANPDIANVFFRAGYMEIWGRGTLNIIELCKQAGLPEPEYEDKWGGIAISFKSKSENSLEINQKILNLIKNNSKITTSEIADHIKISRRTITNHIAKLKEHNKLIRIGSTKGGFWKIVS